MRSWRIVREATRVDRNLGENGLKGEVPPRIVVGIAMPICEMDDWDVTGFDSADSPDTSSAGYTALR